MFIVNIGTTYTYLNIEIINFHTNYNQLIAKISLERKLNYKKIENLPDEFINDLTQDELEAGLIEVEKICKEVNDLELLKKYYELYFNNDNEKVLAKLKELKLFEVNQKYNLEVEKVLKEYIPDTEMLTWEMQETESRAFKSSNYEDESVCPFMKKLSTIRNYPLKDLCDKAIYKADLYRESVAILIGLRQSLQDKIEKVTTKEDLDKIDLNQKRLKRVKEKLNG